MRIMRTVGTIGIAKALFDQARRPENRARIKNAVAKVRSRGSGAAR